MKEKCNKIFQAEYTPLEWKCMKLLFALGFYALSLGALLEFRSIHYPIGILSLADFSWLTIPFVKILIAIFLFSLLVMYVLEIRMVLATFFIFLISLFVFSLGESNGIWGRNGLLSLIFFVQFLAYLFYYLGVSSNITKNRVQFSIQIIAAVYTLAALSKLSVSGLGWINEGPNLAVQVLKSYNYEYATSGNIEYQLHAIRNADWIIGHPMTIKLLLFAALFLETFSFLSLINKKWAFIYGWLLLSMHIGMKLTMNIFFESISCPMICFLINPLFGAVIRVRFFRARY